MFHTNPSQKVRVVRRLRSDVARECASKRRLAEALEQSGAFLVRDSKALRLAKRKRKQGEAAVRFFLLFLIWSCKYSY
jgi:hypothetical protein